jgi:hypothetical protein
VLSRFYSDGATASPTNAATMPLDNAPPPKGPTPDILYAEVGPTSHQYLGWRERLVVGYVAVVAGLAVAFAWMDAHHAQLDWLVPVVGTFLSVVFWLVEELETGIQGVYTAINADPSPNEQWSRRTVSHRTVLAALFGIGVVAFGAAAVYLLV